MKGSQIEHPPEKTTLKKPSLITVNFKKATNLGKLYLFPKIDKGLRNVPGHSVISNCRTPAEKVSKFRDHYLHPLMKQGNSNIKDTSNFLQKLRAIGEIPKEAILVTADEVRLNPSISNDEGLKVLRKHYDKFIDKTAPAEDIIKVPEFVLKKNLFEFNSKFYKQVSGIAIGTKFSPPHACIFMGYIEISAYKRFIDCIFFIWADTEENLDRFLENHYKFYLDL